MSELTRRQFLKVTGMSLVGSSLVAMGFSPEPAFAEVREYKLARATETRNTCPYCSVACGILMYGLGDSAKNAQPSIFHIEGDPDHPVNRGTLCPKGAGLIDFVHSESRLKFPEYRAPGSDHWQRIELGRRARSHCQVDEAGPRRELRCEDAGGPDGEPVGDHRHAGRIGAEQRSRVFDAQGCALSRHSWHSTTRLVCDTARRWQVLPRRLAVER